MGRNTTSWKLIEAAICCVTLSALGCASVAPNLGTNRDATRSETAAQAKPDRLDTDAPKVTMAGNTFVAPAGWTFVVRGPATILEAPEGGSFVAIVDVKATDATAALAAAWAAYKPDAKWPLKSTSPIADRDGWTNRTTYNYQTSPNEHRDVDADVRRANDIWTVTISDMDQGVGEKRLGQVLLIYGKFLPKGYQRESFAGKKAHTLDAARIRELSQFIEKAMKETGVPGVSMGLYQDRKVVFAGGFGVRQLGSSTKVDSRTRYMIASNTKALVTLMLAELVDAKKMTWDTPAISLLPTFKLGDPQTTRSVLVKHLICACTGMPRQDLEWFFEFQNMTPESAMTLLGTMQPTSAFGELFQYSNMMAAAAGYIGGHIVSPDLEFGTAYDRAMQSYVFDPLRMTDTTQDFAKAQQGDFATAHAPDVDGYMTLAEGRVNLSIVPIRPAGGAWSTVNDVLNYVAMELADGKLPDGTQYISKETLLARRAPQVAVGIDQVYGMGLMVDTVYGTPVVHHGGDMIGFHSDMMWLPEHGVGAVVLTNGDPGWLIRTVFRRKLLEVLFDGKSEADGQIVAQAKQFYDEMAGDRKLLTVPVDIAVSQALAPHYASASLGQITVVRDLNRVSFDFGAFSSEMGSRVNPDGTTSLITIAPGVNGSEFVVGHTGAKRTLTLRDAQHEYTYEER